MQLEDYKSNLAREQFLAEAKWKALQDMRVVYSELGQALVFDLSHDIGKNVEFMDAYNLNVSKFVSHWNKNSVLFSDQMANEIESIVRIHDAVALRQTDLQPGHADFIALIDSRFDQLTRTALGEEILGSNFTSGKLTFELLSVDNSDSEPGAAARHFQANWDKFLHQTNR